MVSFAESARTRNFRQVWFTPQLLPVERGCGLHPVGDETLSGCFHLVCWCFIDSFWNYSHCTSALVTILKRNRESLSQRSTNHEFLLDPVPISPPGMHILLPRLHPQILRIFRQLPNELFFNICGKSRFWLDRTNVRDAGISHNFSNSLIIHAALTQPEHLILVRWMSLEIQ